MLRLRFELVDAAKCAVASFGLSRGLLRAAPAVHPDWGLADEDHDSGGSTDPTADMYRSAQCESGMIAKSSIIARLQKSFIFNFVYQSRILAHPFYNLLNFNSSSVDFI